MKTYLSSMKLAGLLAVLALAATLPGCPPPQQGTRYFLVAERTPSHGDSYILPLSATADINHALALIRKPASTGMPIVVAKFEDGSGDGAYVNRDLRGGGTPWSWHISEFVGFADFTVEIYDGWPTYLEENYDNWVSTTGNTLGFWSYTVVREVSVTEMLYGTTARSAANDFGASQPDVSF